jgi:hypothetical protein
MSFQEAERERRKFFTENRLRQCIEGQLIEN